VQHHGPSHDLKLAKILGTLVQLTTDLMLQLILWQASGGPGNYNNTNIESTIAETLGHRQKDDINYEEQKSKRTTPD
jgi:hypothetical protein